MGIRGITIESEYLKVRFVDNTPRSKIMDHFYYALVDSYLYLMIFREPEFIFWTSASGGQAVRSPAWDYEFKSGPQLAGEKRSYHTRLVYKPYAGIEDILLEVDRFLSGDVRDSLK